MKKLLSVIVAIIVTVWVTAAAVVLPYGVGYLFMGCTPPETMGTPLIAYWVIGFLLIVIVTMVCYPLWKAAYEKVYDWLR